ncbi:helix-turn-helix domain-containing protein [Pseudalkalibacillus berkeleyi]|uniref:Helix-turn-helix domain-containing protein n=1 Tax=Pseudalkalibacillus berkeleyi TaxID=1069813 RepID=A0ABS9H763_9BACL|nr:helix-turn-helix domain-containing protein [Pseudalkalibacillus berkeleyi]MCF6139525.1 helix-turn-helix domain-containing protein [Pseudalkalibacillus berkeleyi]
MIGGAKIYYHRMKKGLTQNELSNGICSISYLSKIENDSIQSNPETLKLLCKRLDINFEDNQNLNSELKKQLLDVYTLIKQREIIQIKNKMEEIKLKVKDVEDPTINSLYKLINARYYLLVKDYKKAKHYLEKVENLTKFFSDELKYFFNSFSGLYCYLSGDYKSSLRFYQEAKQISQAMHRYEPEFIYQLSILYSKLGRNTKSIITAYEALAAFDKNANYERSVDCHILLGIGYNRIGDDQSAELYLSKALKASRYLPNNDYIQSIAYHNLGLVNSNRGKSIEAIINYKKSIENNLHIQTTYMLAKEYYIIENHTQSYNWLNKGLSYVENIEDSYSFKLWILKYEIDKNESSKEYQELLTKAVSYFEEKEDYLNLRECYEKLGHYYSEKFMYKNSSIYYLKANNLKLFS